MADLAHLAFHEVEVVEQPLGGGRDRLAMPHVAGEGAVRLTEHAGVVREAAQQSVGAAPGVSRERERRGEDPGALLQALDAEEFAVQRAGIETDRPQLGPARPSGGGPERLDAHDCQRRPPFLNGPRVARGPDRDDAAMLAHARCDAVWVRSQFALSVPECSNAG